MLLVKPTVVASVAPTAAMEPAAVALIAPTAAIPPMLARPPLRLLAEVAAPPVRVVVRTLATVPAAAAPLVGLLAPAATLAAVLRRPTRMFGACRLAPHRIGVRTTRRRHRRARLLRAPRPFL